MDTCNLGLPNILAIYFKNTVEKDEKDAYEHLCERHPFFHSTKIIEDKIVSRFDVLENIEKYIKTNNFSRDTQLSFDLLYKTIISNINKCDFGIVNDRKTLLDCMYLFSAENNITYKELQLDIMYLLMCQVVGKQSKAKRLKVGEMIVTQQGSILIGYNGTAPNTNNECEYTDPETGKLVSYEHVICGLQNAVYKSSRDGVSTIGGTAYSTHSPCVRCVPVALSVGIKRFVYIEKYRLTEHLKELEKNNVKLLQIPQKLLDLYQKYN